MGAVGSLFIVLETSQWTSVSPLAQAYDNYADNGVDPVLHNGRASTSRFKAGAYTLHSSTFLLNVGAFCGIRGCISGWFEGSLEGLLGVFRGCFRVVRTQYGGSGVV